MKYIITEQQYRLLTEENDTLLSEGRKSELVSKYRNKFKEYPLVYQTVLSNDFIVKTNYKYADFLLKELHPVSSKEEITDAIDIINNFDKYQKNLDKKDINDYKSLDELENVITLYLASKGDKVDVEKIYENDRFLVVIPKNEEASCKYGANTKWCVTSKGTGHFDRYTKGKQLLYFIIDKKNSTDAEFSKVAVHIGNDGKFTYYDSKDKPLSEKEIRLLNYAISDVIKAVKDDYEKKVAERAGSFLDDVFSLDIFSASDLTYEIPGSDKFLSLKLFGFESETPGKATGILDIFLYDELYQSTLIDKYTLYITYKQLSDKTLAIEGEILGSDDYIDNFIDLELSGEELWYYPIQFESDEKTTAKKIREIILGEIHKLLADNDVDINFIEQNKEN